MTSRYWVVGSVVACALLFSGDATAQWSRSDDGCGEDRVGRDADRYCLTLTGEFDDPGRLTIDGGSNGGVSVQGWSGDAVEVRASVRAHASSEARAREIADQVQVVLRNGRLSADGPDTGRRESWSVSFDVMVPEETDLDIETNNGGIGLTAVNGRIEFRAVNGGVHLADVGGDVTGRTTNGGLDIELSGRTWRGERLDVETTNGGVTLQVPSGYSADLETGTVNGGIEIDFPVTVHGRIGRRLATTLGDGGPLVRATTTNGGVHLIRSGNAIR